MNSSLARFSVVAMAVAMVFGSVLLAEDAGDFAYTVEGALGGATTLVLLAPGEEAGEMVDSPGLVLQESLVCSSIEKTLSATEEKCSTSCCGACTCCGTHGNEFCCNFCFGNCPTTSPPAVK